MKRILIDTGPLVGAMAVNDQHHAAAVAQLQELRPPFVTTWPVLTEAAWLLRGRPELQHLLESFEKEPWLEIAELDAAAPKWLGQFLTRYVKAGAQLADASLMYVAERDGLETIFTFDRRDFSIYRTTANRALTIIP